MFNTNLHHKITQIKEIITVYSKELTVELSFPVLCRKCSFCFSSFFTKSLSFLTSTSSEGAIEETDEASDEEEYIPFSIARIYFTKASESKFKAIDCWK